MNKAKKGEFLRSLKFSCINFVIITIVFIIVSKVFFSQKPINLVLIVMIVFSSSIGSSIGYFNKYKKYTTKILYKDVIDKDIIIKLQKIMKKMHWSYEARCK